MFTTSSFDYEKYLSNRGWHLDSDSTFADTTTYLYMLQTLAIMQDFVKEEKSTMRVSFGNCAKFTSSPVVIISDEDNVENYEWNNQHPIVKNIKKYFSCLGMPLNDNSIFISNSKTKGLAVFMAEPYIPFVLFLLPLVFPEQFSELDKTLVNKMEDILKQYIKSNVLNLDDLIKTSKFYEEMMETSVKSLSERVMKSEKDKVLARLNNIENDIGNNINNYLKLIKNKKEAELLLAGIETKDNIFIKELFDFLKNNNSCFVEKVDSLNNKITFYITTELSTWKDSYLEALNAQIDSGRGTPFIEELTGINCGVTQEDANLLFDLIFNQQKIKIQVYSNFTLDLTNGHVKCLTGFECHRIFPNRIVNPHVGASCINEAKRMVADFISNNQYVEAIFQLIDATASLNLFDTYIMRALADMIFECKCLLYNNKIYDVKTILPILKEMNNDSI